MRVAISHNRSKGEIIAAVDRSFDEMFQGTGLPVRVIVKERNWRGSVLTFALTAKMGILSTPIKGTVEVTDDDIIIDADLGLLSRFVSEKTAHDAIGRRVKGLLK
jgi:hypothetical protein